MIQSIYNHYFLDINYFLITSDNDIIRSSLGYLIIFHSLFVPDSERVGWGKTTFKETLISVCVTVKLRIRNRPSRKKIVL